MTPSESTLEPLQPVAGRRQFARRPATLRQQGYCVILALSLAVAGELTRAAPLALLDRNGTQVSIEGYAPNIVRITLSMDKDQALAPPGFGINATADAAG